jgi:hypothetical protein
MPRGTISLTEYKKYKHRGFGRQHHRPGVMNRTEQAFSEYLQEHKVAGLILDWWFEAITIRFAEDTRYTADFLVLELDKTLTLIETKSSYLSRKTNKVTTLAHDDSLVKLKTVSQFFPFRCKLAVWQPTKTWAIKEI